MGTSKFTQDVKCHDMGACIFTRDVKCHETGACKFMRDVKCHDTCHLHGDVWSWVRTKKSTRIIAQAARRCSCTGYSSNYFDSAYCTTDSHAYLVVGHVECQCRHRMGNACCAPGCINRLTVHEKC